MFGPSAGYVLKAKDGRIPMMISARAIPDDAVHVITCNGLVYVDTGKRDESNFRIFEEGFLTHDYTPHGE